MRDFTNERLTYNQRGGSLVPSGGWDMSTAERDVYLSRIAAHWNACADALPHLEGLGFLAGPREAAAILRAAVNGEE